MISSPVSCHLFSCLAVIAGLVHVVEASVVINEIMFHPQGDPAEDPAEEWIELHNIGSETMDLGGWRFTRGINFEIPPGTLLPPQGYLVVAADTAVFSAHYPDLNVAVVGGWEGKLSNSGEGIRLENALGATMAELDYASEGDWATRVSGPDFNGFVGWVWENAADGSGHSLERTSARLDVQSGQLWRPSEQPGGTPGAANGTASEDVPPIITKAGHTPIIPRSTDAIKISAKVVDDHNRVASVRLAYRIQSGDEPAWESIELEDAFNTGTYTGTIGPFLNATIIDYYIAARDETEKERTWPAASRKWISGEGLFRVDEWDQFNNALLQVDDSHETGAREPGTAPRYHIIMTPDERAQLRQAQDQSGARFPVDAQYHASFVSVDGTGIKVRHQVSVRDRGFSSRQGNPVSFHMAFGNDNRWNGRKSIQLNSRYPFSQAMGAAMFQLAGLPTTEAVPVEVRVNGVDTADGQQVGYGRYVRAEPMNGDWIERLYPHDADGNLYRVDDHAQIGSGRFTYEGEFNHPYNTTYLKKTNEDVDDYGDIIALTKALNTSSPEDFRAEVEKVMNVDQWLRYLVVNSLIENLEGGLGTGRADDFGMYRGINDPRFVLLPHDLDTVMGIGERSSDGRNHIFVYRQLQGLRHLLSEDVPTIRRFYQIHLSMLDSWFRPEIVDPVIDQVLGGWVPAAKVKAAKDFVRKRRNNVLQQIPSTYAAILQSTSGESVDGMPVASEENPAFEGHFHVGETGSILVNGHPAQLSYGQMDAGDPGSWSFPSQDALRLRPGVNRITVQFFSQPDGDGMSVHQETLRIYHQPASRVEVSGVLTPSEGTTILWRPEDGPFHVLADATVPAGVTLRIEAGVQIYFYPSVRLSVHGTLEALGTENDRVRFSHPPEAPYLDDPLLPGAAPGPGKWGGILLVDSLSPENRIEFADFVNAQPLDNQGSIGVIRSNCVIHHCTFAGTHHRMIYGRHCSLTVQHCTFPDMFAPSEDPVALGLDGAAEQIRIESDPTSPEIVDDPRFLDGFPAGGRLRLYHNQFHGNKGTNAVAAIESGRRGVSPVLDCRHNRFDGPVDAAHLVLTGDAYVAWNTFENAHSRPSSTGAGAHAITAGPRGPGTTVVVAGNVFREVDRAILCTADTATIFEHNGCFDFYSDYHHEFGPITQEIETAAVDLRRSGADSPSPGAYLGFNAFHGATKTGDTNAGFPRLVSGADQDGNGVPAPLSGIQFHHNLIDPLLVDPSISESHPDGVFDSRWGEGNVTGDPGSRLAFNAIPYGAAIASGAYIIGGPVQGTANSEASFVIGGPGIFAYRWRLDDSEWSAPVVISNAAFPREQPISRTATLSLTGLAEGSHRLEVIGRDFVGEWQAEADATAREWIIEPGSRDLILNEVRTTGGNAVELRNLGDRLELGGWRLAEEPDDSDPYIFANGNVIEAGGYVVVDEVTLDRDGDTLLLIDPEGNVVDQIQFGRQADGFTLGRFDGVWTLTQETLGAPNIRATQGDPQALRISEVLAIGGRLFRDDWIELHNSSVAPVALAGLRLTDNPEGDPEAHVFPAHTYLEPLGYWKLVADGKRAEGHVNFAVSAEGESLALTDERGRILDLVLITPQTRDRSMAWEADGSAHFPDFPTDGFAAASASEIERMRGLIDHLRISEIHYSQEFLELTNTGSLPLNLTGIRFTRGIDFVFPEYHLKPGAYLVLARDAGTFKQHYPDAALSVIAGYEGKLDNSGETITLALPQPFGAAILDFRYEAIALPGHSIELTDFATLDWQSSASAGGSPGRGPGEPPPVPITYATWAESHGISDPESDLDGDGWSSFLEYALGGDPHARDTFTVLTVLTVSPETDEIAFHTRADRPDLTYAIEESGDLQTWKVRFQREAFSEWPQEVTIRELDDGIQQVMINLAIEDGVERPPGFIRLKVEKRFGD